jgi:hypothetical protein
MANLRALAANRLAREQSGGLARRGGVWRYEVLVLSVSCMPLAISACGKTDVRLTSKGIPIVRPAWDEPTLANGFVPVAPAATCATHGSRYYAAAPGADAGASE